MTTDRTISSEPLRGEHVAFTGRLASLTRAAAIRLVRSAGGQWSSTVTLRTSLLVIGQEGWPLRKDGRLTRKLLQARRLQRLRPIAIIPEADFLARAGLHLRSAPAQKQMSIAQLAATVGIPGQRLRSWVEERLVQPATTVDGVHYFDFGQARWIQTLGRFARSGISAERLRKSLAQLRQWLPEAEAALAGVHLLERDGRLLVRLGADLLAEPHGQLAFDFADDKEAAAVVLPTSERSAADWFGEAYAHEQSGALAAAARAYRMALRVGGPDAVASFNLANVLNLLGLKEQAAERLEQVIEMEGGWAEAWNNLGVILSDLGRRDEAIAAFEEAVAADPAFADAHYNLADALQEAGRRSDARPHWKAYLEHDRTSAWAAHAMHQAAGR